MTATERYGSGPTLLLLHGSPGGAQTWSSIGKRLADRYSIVAPTLPGHAAGDPIVTAKTSDIAVATLTAIGPLAGPVTIGAHSFGAVIALQMALAGRLDIDRLVLFEPVAFGILVASGEQAAFDANKPTFDRYAARHRDGDPDAVAIMADFWFGAGAFAHMPPPVQDFMRQQATVNVRDVEAVFRDRYEPSALKALAMPVTIVHGERSPPVARLIAERLAASLENGRTVALPGANHAMLNSHPDAVAKLIGGD